MKTPRKSFMKESTEFFQKKMVKIFSIQNPDENYDCKITGAEKIVSKLSAFSSLGHYLNIDDSRTRCGPDAFNSIRFDSRSKILQIGRHDADAKGNVTYSELFSLVPKALYAHYCPNSAHCVLVLTNKIQRKLGIDDIIATPEKCGYCNLVDAETSTIADLSDYINPLVIYPKGSQFLKDAPYFLDYLIAKEELNSLAVKSR